MRIGRAQGYTLTEIMVTTVVVAVLLAIAAPSFATLIKNNRMLSLVYEMRAVLNTVRSEALAQRTSVTLCSSNDELTCSGQWRDGYIAFRDSNGNGAVDNPNTANGDAIILVKSLDVDISKFSYSNPETLIRFDSQGFATRFNGTFTFCDDRGTAAARGLILMPSGMVRAAQDTQDSTVILDHEGNALDCD